MTDAIERRRRDVIITTKKMGIENDTHSFSLFRLNYFAKLTAEENFEAAFGVAIIV